MQQVLIDYYQKKSEVRFVNTRLIRANINLDLHFYMPFHAAQQTSPEFSSPILHGMEWYAPLVLKLCAVFTATFIVSVRQCSNRGDFAKASPRMRLMFQLNKFKFSKFSQFKPLVFQMKRTFFLLP